MGMEKQKSSWGDPKGWQGSAKPQFIYKGVYRLIERGGHVYVHNYIYIYILFFYIMYTVYIAMVYAMDLI